MNMGMNSAWSDHDTARTLIKLNKMTLVIKTIIVVMMTLLMVVELGVAG